LFDDCKPVAWFPYGSQLALGNLGLPIERITDAVQERNQIGCMRVIGELVGFIRSIAPMTRVCEPFHDLQPSEPRA
jgi:hypothetical protein